MLLFAWLGCVGTEDDACVPGGDPWLEIGLGLEEYSPIADGGEFPLIHGPQGGYHLEIGLEAGHLDVSTLATGHLTGTIGGVVLAETEPWLDFRCEADGSAQTSWGTRLIYDSTPEALDGQTTVVTATVTDAAGAEVTVERTFVIRDTP